MKQDWEIKKLSDVIEENNKSTIKSKGNSEGIYPFYISGKNIKFINRSLVDGSNIFLPTGGNFFVHFYNGKACYSTDTWSLKTNSKADIKYFYYFLLLNEELIGLKYFKGATIKHLQKKDFKDIEIPLPPLLEQQYIVSILDEAFAAIAKAKANAEQNLKNAKYLFKSYLQEVFKEGPINTTIGEQVLLQRGFDITKEQQKNGNIPVVSSGGIKSYHEKAMVQAPGVVIGRKGTLGKVFFLECDFWPHDTTLWIKDYKQNNPKFVYYFFTNFDVKPFDSGTANPALNRNQVHPIPIRWYLPKQQQTIVHQLDTLQAKTQKLEAIYQKKIENLEELRKSILQKAFVGELKTEKDIKI